MHSNRIVDNRVNLYQENSPGHLQRPGLYLKQLRDRGDYRTCDITIILDGSKDLLHSIVAGAHSSKMARTINSNSLPITLDMSNFPPSSVRKVIDWMYQGSFNFNFDNLSDHLRVATELGVVYLHRQLEQTLRAAAMQGQISHALNIATHAETGISPETTFMLVKELGLLQEKRSHSPDDISSMTLRAVLAVVSARLKQSSKRHLINVGLMWLRHRSNRSCINEVVANITVQEMTEAALVAFRMTLLSAMRNPYLCQFVEVSEKNGWLCVNIDNKDTMSQCGTPRDTTEGVPDEAEVVMRKTSQAAVNKRIRTQSEMDDFRALPPDDEVFGNPEYHTVPKGRRSFTPSELNEILRLPPVYNTGTFTRWERYPPPPGRPTPAYSRPLRDSFSESPNSDLFGEDIGTRRQLDKDIGLESTAMGRSFTVSEMASIQRLPDVFQPSEFKAYPKIHKDRSFTKSELKHIKALPDCFGDDQGTHKTRSFTRSEIEDIARIPNAFVVQKTAKTCCHAFNRPGEKSKKGLIPQCEDCPKTERSVSTVSSDGVKTATSISGTSMAELGLRKKAEEKEKKEGTPKKNNSAYANVPKGGSTSSHYAF